jgi:hypothetical protein
MGRFWDFVSRSNASDGRLPLIHATDLFCFRQVRADGRLEPAECPIYKPEKLLYFFYGRPSYRPHAQLDTVTAKALLPVCLVMSRELTDRAVRIMPFDTGAFSRKMMHPPLHEKMELHDFELAVSANAPMRLIELFYGSERNYYDAMAKYVVTGYDKYDDLEIDSYFRLLHHRANTPFDDRVTAIEVQLHDPIELCGFAHAVILPKPYLDAPHITEQIESWGAISIPYNVKEEFVPKELQGAIFDKLTDFLEQQGWLDSQDSLTGASY